MHPKNDMHIDFESYDIDPEYNLNCTASLDVDDMHHDGPPHCSSTTIQPQLRDGFDSLEKFLLHNYQNGIIASPFNDKVITDLSPCIVARNCYAWLICRRLQTTPSPYILWTLCLYTMHVS